MNDDFTFRSGKFAGKTIAWVKENNPQYLEWVKENQPNMLKTYDKKPIIKPVIKPETKLLKDVVADKPYSVISPNMNFWAEGPDPMSLPYLKKIQEKDLDN